MGEALNHLKQLEQELEDIEKTMYGYVKELGYAKFMLVACSAFVNYLVSKAEKADIKL